MNPTLTRIITWGAEHHIAFALLFSIYGSVLQWFHKLDTNYIMLIGAIQGFLFFHNVSTNYFASKNGNGNGDSH